MKIDLSKPAPWYKFWMPNSGPIGGILAGVFIILLFLLFAPNAEAAGYYENPRQTGCYVAMCSQQQRATDDIVRAIDRSNRRAQEYDYQPPARARSTRKAPRRRNCNKEFMQQEFVACDAMSK